MKEKIFFHSYRKGKISLDQVVEELFSFIKEEPSFHYNLAIGTDSERHNEEDEFVSAIIIHRFGRGGRYFWRRVYLPRSRTMRERIYNEVLFSLSIAQELVKRLKSWANKFDFSLEIHVDIGLNGPTKAMVQEVINLVKGNGFKVKTKPESFGASNVADRLI